MTGDNSGRRFGARGGTGGGAAGAAAAADDNAPGGSDPRDDGYEICDGVADLLAAYDAVGSVAVRGAAGGWVRVEVALAPRVGRTTRGRLAAELDAVFRAAEWYECRHAASAGRRRRLAYVVRPRTAPPG